MDWTRLTGEDRDLADALMHQGWICVTSLDLWRVFGEPDRHASIQVGGWVIQWVIRFEDGTLATVYSDDRDSARHFRVGGDDQTALLRLASVLDRRIKPR